MSKGSLTVRSDRLLTVDKGSGENSSTLDATLSVFAEPVSATETQSRYRITAASIWQARRQGLSLAEILQTLETYSHTEIPANVRADIEQWSQQIDRLTLEADQGRLLLRSHNPLAITAVLRHRILGTFVTQQIDAHTLELRAETYPDVVQTFDDHQYPVLTRQQEGGTSRRRGRGLTKTSVRQAQSGQPRKVLSPKAISPARPRPTALPHAATRPAEILDVLRMQLPRQCQATTRAGRQCKNRARPPASFCRVHADQTPGPESLDPFPHDAHPARYFLDLMLDAGLITMPQLAIIRVGILAGFGLCTWLLYALLMWVGTGWLHLPLASWYMIGCAFVLTCWLPGRVVHGLGFFLSLHVLVLTLFSLLADFFNKDGLILNICFFLIPMVLPAVMLYRYALSPWWGSLLFPLGLVLGTLFYNLLEETSG